MRIVTIATLFSLAALPAMASVKWSCFLGQFCGSAKM
jgi:hypothetical protein